MSPYDRIMAEPDGPARLKRAEARRALAQEIRRHIAETSEGSDTWWYDGSSGGDDRNGYELPEALAADLIREGWRCE